MRIKATARGSIATFIGLLVLSAIFLFPLLVTFTNSFMTEGEVAMRYSSELSIFDKANGITKAFQDMGIIPNSVTLNQYENVLINQPAFLVLLTNSLKIAVPVTVLNVLISTLAAYGFTIWSFKYKEFVFGVYVVVMLMPLQAVLVPNYIIAGFLGIEQSYLGIILPGIFSPFGMFLMRQSMKALPPAYFEAAKIDGAGAFQTFWYIILPQMKSSIAALSMLVFIEYWNLVEQAIIFIKDYTKEPLSVYLSRIAAGHMGLMFAASCVYMLLPLWFLLVGQKDLEKGIELSGIK